MKSATADAEAQHIRNHSHRNPLEEAAPDFECSSHDIDDPFRDHNHLLDRPTIDRTRDAFKAKSRRFQRGSIRIARNDNLVAALAVYLYGDLTVSSMSKLALNLRPRLICQQCVVAEQRPAFFREVGHDRIHHMHKKDERLANGETKGRIFPRRLILQG